MRERVTPLVVLIFDAIEERCQTLAATLGAAGHRVLTRPAHGVDLEAEVARVNPDVVIIDVDAPDRDVLEDLHAINRRQPRPIVVFTEDEDPGHIRAAVRAGVSAYVVGDLPPSRAQPVLAEAIARFEQYQGLQRELSDMRGALADRKDIEKAKGLLMKQRGMDEQAAYAALRSLAMSRNLKLAELARSLVAAAELLA